MIEEVADATGASVARRFGYAYVDGDGNVEPGRARALPRLRRRPARPPAVDGARDLPWLAEAEDQATSWIIANQLPEYLERGPACAALPS